jgi:GT2 family glycosyltransferase
MTVSIIIPTRNRAKSLECTLSSVAMAIHGQVDAEVLIIDNGSPGSTAELVSRFQSQFGSGKWRYFLEPIPGLLSGRHRGAAEADGEILAFLDDDVILSPGWLEGLRGSFRDSSVALVGGPSLPRFEGPPPAWLGSFWRTSADGRRSLGELSLLEIPTQHPVEIEPDMVWGLNFAIRRDVFVESGGFHPDCVPSQLQHFQGDGETGLSQKVRQLGLRAIHHPAVAVQHQIGRDRLSIEYFEARHFYQGVCDSFTALRSSGCKFSEEEPDRCGGQSRGVKNIIRRFFGRSLRSQAVPGASCAADDASPQERCRKAWQHGFDFHQESARRSDVLRQWIMKPDYFDYNYPILEPDFVVPDRNVHGPSKEQ